MRIWRQYEQLNLDYLDNTDHELKERTCTRLVYRLFVLPCLEPSLSTLTTRSSLPPSTPARVARSA